MIENPSLIPPAPIYPVRFWTKYTEDANGVRAVDWVEFTPKGDGKMTLVPEAVVRLEKRTDGVWQAIKPYYEAWKQGQEVPADGTPLAAWHGITPEQIELLKRHHIRTVEDLVAVNDAQRTKIGLPQMFDIQRAAKIWMESKDTRRVEEALDEKDRQIALLQQQMDDLMALLSQPEEGADHSEEPIKRRPGRPRREEAA